MKIKVTQEHIAKRGTSCDRCPAALALHEAGYPLAHVTTYGIYLEGDYGKEPIPLHEDLKWFIDYYDHGQPVQPFEFELDVPDAPRVEV